MTGLLTIFGAAELSYSSGPQKTGKHCGLTTGRACVPHLLSAPPITFRPTIYSPRLDRVTDTPESMGWGAQVCI